VFLRGTNRIFIHNLDEENSVFHAVNRRAFTWRPGFDARSVHVRLVVEKIAPGPIFLPVLRFSPVGIIIPSLRNHEGLV
jgi:hypothetical protein